MITETRSVVSVLTETCVMVTESVRCCTLSISVTSCVFNGFETESLVPD